MMAAGLREFDKIRPSRSPASRNVQGVEPAGWYVLGILVVSLVLLVTEKVGMDVVGIGVIVALALGGVLDPGEAVGGLANPAIVTIAALFVISEGLIRTGAVEFLGRHLIRLTEGSESLLLFLCLLSVAFVSGFINNTPVVVLFVPLMYDVSERTGVSPSKFLLPISFASILGGTCTLIGTSTNLAINGWLEENGAEIGLAPFGMFDFTAFGLIYATVGLLYLFFFGSRWIPVRHTVTSTLGAGRHKEYLTELSIPSGSPFIGKPLTELVGGKAQLRVLQLIRGEQVLWPPYTDEVLSEEDVLLVKAPISEVLELAAAETVSVERKGAVGALEARPREISLAELVITPGSRLVGRTLENYLFHRRTGCHVLALQRHGAHLREQISDLGLAVGDLLLVEGETKQIQNLRRSNDFLLVAGAGDIKVRTARAPLAAGVFATIVLLASLQLHPALDIMVLSLAGCTILVATGVVTARQAYQAIHWPILLLIGGMIALAAGMHRTGLDDALAGGAASALSGWGPWWVLVGVFLVTSLLSQVVNNAAVGLLMISISTRLAAEMGVSPMPFVMGVVFGASACFATPFGYQTNAIVYGPGGYRVRDYVKVGLPLNLILTIVAAILIPVFWPFYG